jgi:hypothetical protein
MLFRSLAVCCSVVLMVLVSPSCVAPGQSAGSAISLHSPSLASRWTTVVEEDGIRYVDPASRLNDMLIRKVGGPGPVMIEPPLVQTMAEGDPAQQKKPYKQKWRHTLIAGQPVRWYQNDEGSGADFPMFKTENFAITTSRGTTEYYQVLVSKACRVITSNRSTRCCGRYNFAEAGEPG